MWKASETDEKQLQNILTGPEGKRRQFYLIYVARTTHISLRNNNKKRSFAQFRLLSLFLVTRLLFTGEPHVSLTPQYTINLRFCLKLKFLYIYINAPQHAPLPRTPGIRLSRREGRPNILYKPKKRDSRRRGGGCCEYSRRHRHQYIRMGNTGRKKSIWNKTTDSNLPLNKLLHWKFIHEKIFLTASLECNLFF